LAVFYGRVIDGIHNRFEQKTGCLPVFVFYFGGICGKARRQTKKQNQTPGKR
jgi:hypothetical protein